MRPKGRLFGVKVSLMLFPRDPNALSTLNTEALRSRKGPTALRRRVITIISSGIIFCSYKT